MTAPLHKIGEFEGIPVFSDPNADPGTLLIVNTKAARKTCSACKQPKPLADFIVVKLSDTKIVGRCIFCRMNN